MPWKENDDKYNEKNDYSKKYDDDDDNYKK
jgi:hypothetical protein